MFRNLVLFLLSLPCLATTRYIANTAGTFSGGTACNGQTAITPATWNSTSESAGDISYICGTITGTSGSYLLQFGWSGTSSNPIILYFDTGAILQSPAFNGNSAFSNCTSGCGHAGAINTFGANYLIIDGQNTGTIQNTENGTTVSGQVATCISGPCSISSTPTQGIYINSSNVIVRNLTIQDIYNNTGSSTSDTDTAGQDSADIFVDELGTNVTVCNNTLLNARVGVELGNQDTGNAVNSNCQSNTFVAGENYFLNTLDDHGWMFNGGDHTSTYNIYANYMESALNWQYPDATYHTDGIIIFNTTGSDQQTLYAFNNYFNWSGGAGIPTAALYCEYGCLGTFFNNLFTVQPNPTTNNYDINMWLGGTTSNAVGPYYSYNNTLIGGPKSTDTYCPSSGSMYFTAENDIVFPGGVYYWYVESGTNANCYIGTINYNLYDPTNGLYWAYPTTTHYSVFSTWQSACSCDANSTVASSNLNATTWEPNSGSPAFGMGTNLTSLCTGGAPALAYLCYDKPATVGVGGSITGNARPSTGAWTVGAYNGSGGGSSPSITSPTTAGAFIGTAFSYQITATNSPSSYSASGLPTGLSVNTINGLISGTPSGSVGASSVTLGATNGSGTGNETLTLGVNNPAGCVLPCVNSTDQTLTWDYQLNGGGGQTEINPTIYVLRLPDTALTGNALALMCTLADAQTISSVDDDGSNTWNQVLTKDDTANSTRMDIWLALNIAPARSITVNFSAATSFTDCTVVQFTHIPTSSAVDVYGSATGNSTTQSSASMTTTQSGDLIFHCVVQDGNTGQGGDRGKVTFSPYAQSGITWHFIQQNFLDGVACQWGIQTSAGAITPTLTASSTSNNRYVSAAVALKVNNSVGTSPSAGMRIVSIHHNNLTGAIHAAADAGWTSPLTLTSPCTGNLEVIAFDTDGSGDEITSITGDTNSNSWELPAYATNDGNALMQFALAGNAICSNSEAFTIAATVVNDQLDVYDIVGASTSPVDSAAGGGASSGVSNTTGDQTTLGTLTAAPTITPSQTGGCVIGAFGQGYNTIGGSSSGQVLDSGYWTATTLTRYVQSGQGLDENDGFAHVCPTTSTSEISFGWVPLYTNTGCGNGTGDPCSYGEWAATAISLLAAPTTTATGSFHANVLLKGLLVY